MGGQCITGAILDGRYELRRVLGQGSEGTVFEAVHRFTGQRHAVKIASTKIAAAQEWKRVRLLREARALGLLHHPNIVTITDAGVSEDGYPFVAMELLEGRSVEGLIAARGRFAIPDAVGLAIQVCDALQAAHEVGVLHRDIKPANIIIIREGLRERAKVVDFGTAKAIAPGAERLTAAGALVGTPAYMAPEQLMAMDVDEGVDVYGVGALLYECLTGAVPYLGAYPQVLMAACSDQPPPSVRGARPQVMGELDAVVTKALAKKREDRFKTVGDLALALRQACTNADGLTRLLVDLLPMTAETRRKYPRAPYRTPVNLVLTMGETSGRSEDISEGGMLLLCESPCAQGEELSVRFALPIEGKVAVCKGRVQWVRGPERAVGRHAIGIEFLDATSDLRASLNRYVSLMSGEPVARPTAPVPPPLPQSPATPKVTIAGTPAAKLARGQRVGA